MARWALAAKSPRRSALLHQRFDVPRSPLVVGVMAPAQLPVCRGGGEYCSSARVRWGSRGASRSRLPEAPNRGPRTTVGWGSRDHFPTARAGRVRLVRDLLDVAFFEAEIRPPLLHHLVGRVRWWQGNFAGTRYASDDERQGDRQTHEESAHAHTDGVLNAALGVNPRANSRRPESSRKPRGRTGADASCGSSPVASLGDAEGLHGSDP